MFSSKTRNRFFIFAAIAFLLVASAWPLSKSVRDARFKAITFTASRLASHRLSSDVIVTDFTVVDDSYVSEPDWWSTIEYAVIETPPNSETATAGRILVMRYSNSNSRRLRSLLANGKLSGNFQPAYEAAANKARQNYRKLSQNPSLDKLSVIVERDLYTGQAVLFCLLALVLLGGWLALGGLVIAGLNDELSNEDKLWKAQLELLQPKIENCKETLGELETNTLPLDSQSFLDRLTDFQFPPPQPSGTNRFLIGLSKFLISIAIYIAGIFLVQWFIRTSTLIGTHSEWLGPTVHYACMAFGPLAFLSPSFQRKRKPIIFKLNPVAGKPSRANVFGKSQAKLIENIGFSHVGTFTGTGDTISVNDVFLSPEKRLLVRITLDSFSVESILRTNVLLVTESHAKATTDTEIIKQQCRRTKADKMDLVTAIQLHCEAIERILMQEPSTAVVEIDQQKLPELLTWSTMQQLA